MNRNQPAQMIPQPRRPVLSFFDPAETETCVLCRRDRTPEQVHPEYRTGYIQCVDIGDCRRYRNRDAEPMVIRVSATHLSCACCHERFPSGYRHLQVQGGGLFHYPHGLCGPKCQERRAEAVSA